MTGSIGWCIFGCGKLSRRAYSAMLKGTAYGPDVCRHKRGTGTKINPGVPRE